MLLLGDMGLTGVVSTRHKAVEVLLAITAGAYQTTLLTYMIQRDLFPSVMKVWTYPSIVSPIMGGCYPAY